MLEAPAVAATTVAATTTCSHCGREFVPVREGLVYCRRRVCQSARRAATPPAERKVMAGRFRAREFRAALKAHLRAGGDLERLAKKTKIDRADLDALLRGRFHWLSPAAAKALQERIRVPVVVEHRELAAATIPVSVIRPYLDAAVDEHGITRAEGVIGVAARRIFGLRSQDAVTPEVAERIVCAAEGAWAFYDDPALRRFWWASLPADTLHLRPHKASHARSRERREARRLVAA